MTPSPKFPSLHPCLWQPQFTFGPPLFIHEFLFYRVLVWPPIALIILFAPEIVMVLSDRCSPVGTCVLLTQPKIGSRLTFWHSKRPQTMFYVACTADLVQQPQLCASQDLLGYSFWLSAVEDPARRPDWHQAQPQRDFSEGSLRFVTTSGWRPVVVAPSLAGLPAQVLPALGAAAGTTPWHLTSRLRLHVSTIPPGLLRSSLKGSCSASEPPGCRLQTEPPELASAHQCAPRAGPLLPRLPDGPQ